MCDCVCAAPASIRKFDLPRNSVFDIGPSTPKPNIMQRRNNVNVHNRQGRRSHMCYESRIILPVRSTEHWRQRPTNIKPRLSVSAVIQETRLWKVPSAHTVRIATKVSNKISRVELLIHDRRPWNISSRELDLENKFHQHIWRWHIENRSNW